MTRDPGRSRRSSGLPRSAVPFAGPERGPGTNGAGSADHAPGDGHAPEAVEPPSPRVLLAALWTSRAADERLAALHDEGRLPLLPSRPPLHEGGVVAAAHAIRIRDDGSGDVLAPTRRAAGALLLLGTDLETFFREHLAERTGSLHGPLAELHRVDFERGLFAPVAPLGVAVEVMAGITLAFRLNGEGRVGVVFDSDRASSTGSWHEGLVFAAARRCPLVVVVERGPADPAFPRPRDTRLEHFGAKGAAYGTPASSVDGADVLAATAALRAAVEGARAGGGVHLVEIRYGMDEGEPDPVVRLRAALLEEGASAEELDSIEQEARRRVDEAAERALAGQTGTGAAPSTARLYAGAGAPAGTDRWAAARASRPTRDRS